MDDVFVRYLNLPVTVNAVTVVDDDGTYNVYINERLSFFEQKRALKHELCHIRKNHLYNADSVELCENTAKAVAKPIYK